MTLIRVVVVAVTVTSAACGGSGATGALTAPTPPVAAPPGQPVTGVQLTVVSVSPNVVSTAGDAWGTVIGTGFQPGATIRFGATVINSVFRDSTTMQFARSGRHAPGAVDLTVINPGGEAAILAGAYTYAPPDSFDADGVWNAHTDARNDYTTEMHFTIRDHVLVSLSCGGISVVSAPLPLNVANDGFSIGDVNGFGMSGVLVSQSTSSGSVNSSACGDGRWWGDKSPGAAHTQFAGHH